MRFDFVEELLDEWSYKSINEICSKVTSGGTPSRSNKGFYIDGTIPWLKTKEFNNGYVYSTEEKITEVAIEKSSAKLLPKNTVMMAMYGATVGELTMLGTEMACNQACCAMIVDPAEADYRYLFYVLLFAKSEIKLLATGAAQQNLSAKSIKEFEFPFPSLATQKEIADTLAGFDRKIWLNSQTNQTLEQIAQAIFKSWFVDFEPVKAKMAVLEAGGTAEQAELAAMSAISAKDEAALKQLQAEQPDAYTELAQTAALFPSAMEESELGEIPEGWEVAAISEFGKVVCGKTPSKKKHEYYGDDVPFIKIPDMHGNVFATSTSELLSTHGAASQPKKTIPKGSVCVSCIATVGQVVIASKESHTNQQINSIVPAKESYTPYLYFSMKMKYKLLHDLASGGSATLNLNTGNFSKIKILLPKESVLNAYQQYALPLLTTIYENVCQNHTLSDTRDTLLPKLLTGGLPITNTEVAP